MLSLSRKTSHKYLPFIDGFRALIIFPVIIEHFIISYEKSFSPIYSILFNNYLTIFLGNGMNSVLLFFTISAFVSTLPFARRAFNGEPNIDKKTFYIRRLVRIGYPYIILLTLILLTHVYILHKSSLENIIPHYIASAFYVHSIVFQEHSTLNYVLWSLEIEMQFYILVPFISYIFLLKSNVRYILYITLITSFSLFNTFIHLPFNSLLNYFQYFISGILVTDVYLSYQEKLAKSYIYDILGIACFCIYWIQSNSSSFIFPYILFGVIFFTCFSKKWSTFLSLKGLTIIGSMTYSIYILHQPLLALVLKRIAPNHIIGENICIDFSARLMFSLFIVMIASIIFYISVERPAMNFRWPKKTTSQKMLS